MNDQTNGLWKEGPGFCVEHIETETRIYQNFEFQSELEQQKLDGKKWLVDPDGEQFFYADLEHMEKGNFEAAWHLPPDI